MAAMQGSSAVGGTDVPGATAGAVGVGPAPAGPTAGGAGGGAEAGSAGLGGMKVTAQVERLGGVAFRSHADRRYGLGWVEP